jgi:hypothetical protein
VFKVVHQPADLAALRGVTVWLRLTLYDERGEELGEREITHEADLEYPDRDRLMFSDGRVYGRLGGAVFVERLRRPWPTLDDEARGELKLMGMLLRAPWIFAEGRRYVVFPVEYDAWQGAEMVRVRIERRPARDRVLGPQRVATPVDRFELICDPVTLAPRQLRYYLAETGVSRRILLDDYREVGGVRMPWRRTFLVDDDRVAMVMRIMRIEVGQRFVENHFRPQLR